MGSKAERNFLVGRQLHGDGMAKHFIKSKAHDFGLRHWRPRLRLSTLKLGVILLVALLLLVRRQLWRFSPLRIAQCRLSADKPLAHTVNGTYAGVYDAKWDQYHFLGMPYALPPLGRLRFRPPHPTNKTWESVRDATDYGPICVGYGGHAFQYPQSEDCLTISVVIPAGFVGCKRSLLPVGVWIYGGAVNGGGMSDGRYNMSGIVSHAAAHGMPFIAVSFNFRSAIWGFIAGREAQGSGNLNIGLRDQRLALHWIQENIAAFGGDPRKVTLWGGSNGAAHVGLHLVAYGGRDDGLFRAAIMQSGSAMTRTSLKQVSAQTTYDLLISRTSCADADDTLDCLRGLSTEEVDAAYKAPERGMVNTLMVSHSMAVIDGDLLPTYSSLSLKDSRMVKVPILIGISSNEGLNIIPEDLAVWEDLKKHLLSPARQYPPSVVERLLSFYPAGRQTETLEPSIGRITDLDTYNRVDRLLHDVDYGASKRLMCDSYSRYTNCYSYRFDAATDLGPGNPRAGVRHGAEIAPVFQNFDGLGFYPHLNPFEGRAVGYFEMAKAVGLMWAGFITQLNTNVAFEGEPWPRSTVEAPKNLVINETAPYFWAEDDVVRREATDYINEIQHSIFRK